MTAQVTAQTVGEQLSVLVAQVRQQGTVDALTTAQIMSGRRRTRLRLPGSSRHLAEVITARPGRPAGVVSHTRVTGALQGQPAHALDEVLVVAIVEACHDLCGSPATEAEIQQWRQLVHRAAESTFRATHPA